MRKKNMIIAASACAFITLALITGTFTSVLDRNYIEGEVEGAEEQNDSDNGNDDINDKVDGKLALVNLTPEQIQDGKIEILKVKNDSIQLKICVPGKIAINTNQYAHVVSKIDGIAQEVKVDLGDNVKAGDVLALLESREMADTKGAFLNALRKQKLADNLLKRETDLKSKKVSAEQDYIDAVAAADDAKMQLNLSYQNLKVLGLSKEDIQALQNEGSSTNLRSYSVKAPIDGTIIKRDITIGEVLKTNQEVYEIANLKNVWLEMGIYPKDLKVVKEGQTVEVVGNDQLSPAIAKIIYLSPLFDEDSHSVYALAEIDNSSGEWRPGSYVCANIITDTVHAPLVINQEAIQAIDGENYVFVRTGTGFEMRPVSIGNSDGKKAEILSGLSMDEQYAAKNAFLLKAESGKSSEDEEE